MSILVCIFGFRMLFICIITHFPFCKCHRLFKNRCPLWNDKWTRIYTVLGCWGQSAAPGKKHSAVDARRYVLSDRWQLALGFENLNRSPVTKDTASFFHVLHTNSLPWETLSRGFSLQTNASQPSQEPGTRAVTTGWCSDVSKTHIPVLFQDFSAPWGTGIQKFCGGIWVSVILISPALLWKMALYTVFRLDLLRVLDWLLIALFHY